MHDGVMHTPDLKGHSGEDTCCIKIYRYPQLKWEREDPLDKKNTKMKIVSASCDGAQLVHDGVIDLTHIETNEQVAQKVAQMIVDLKLKPQKGTSPDYEEHWIYVLCDDNGTPIDQLPAEGTVTTPPTHNH